MIIKLGWRPGQISVFTLKDKLYQEFKNKNNYYHLLTKELLQEIIFTSWLTN